MQHTCNIHAIYQIHATFIQTTCTIDATQIHNTCNIDATYIQHNYEIHTTYMQIKCNTHVINMRRPPWTSFEPLVNHIGTVRSVFVQRPDRKLPWPSARGSLSPIQILEPALEVKCMSGVWCRDGDGGDGAGWCTRYHHYCLSLLRLFLLLYCCCCLCKLYIATAATTIIHNCSRTVFRYLCHILAAWA